MKHGRMAIAGLFILAACSGNDVKTTLGLDRGAPDEFRVVSRPPLSVPPQFNLRPPGSPADNVAAQTPTSDQAKALITGSVPAIDVTAPNTPGTAVKPVAVTPPGTSAEEAFLKNVGATQADPQIRNKIVEDQIAAQQPAPEEKSWYNFWDSSTTKPDPLVNANKESQRIKTDEDSGQSVTTGDTPTVKQRDTGLLGQILGY